MTEGARRAFELAKKHAPDVRAALVLPGVPGGSAHVRRDLARDWIQRAQAVAGLPLVKGKGYHAFRRKFASELRDAPLRNLCDLGGWKDPLTVVKCYQRPSEEAMRDALSKRRVLES